MAFLGSVKTRTTCTKCNREYQPGESRFLESGLGYVCGECFFGKPVAYTGPIEPLVTFG